MIEVRHLTKSFEDKTVLDDIDAVFETGKTNLIIGQSGSGKTVLMKNLVGQGLPGTCQPGRRGRQISRRNIRRHAEARGHRPRHRAQSQVSFLR